jgi:photosystem II stability/assembly factor-like uncharacterized protein
VQCSLAVRTSLNGGRTWTAAAPLPSGFQPDQVIDFGISGLLLGTPTKGDVAITGDGGRTWKSIHGRCSPGNPNSLVDTFTGSEIWELCGPQPLQLYVSEDGGTTWTLKPPITFAIAGGGLLSPTSGIELLLTAGEPYQISGLYATTDHGSTWHEVSGGRGFSYIVFGADGFGWAFDGNGNMFKSADHGLTWTRMSTAL